MTCSPGNPARGFAPASTLMPGMTPAVSRALVKPTPSDVDCRMVSSNMITPLMNCSIPRVVNSISR